MLVVVLVVPRRPLLLFNAGDAYASVNLPQIQSDIVTSKNQTPCSNLVTENKYVRIPRQTDPVHIVFAAMIPNI